VSWSSTVTRIAYPLDGAGGECSGPPRLRLDHLVGGQETATQRGGYVNADQMMAHPVGHRSLLANTNENRYC
jgi:hypothetical protein